MGARCGLGHQIVTETLRREAQIDTEIAAAYHALWNAQTDMERAIVGLHYAANDRRTNSGRGRTPRWNMTTAEALVRAHERADESGYAHVTRDVAQRINQYEQAQAVAATALGYVTAQDARYKGWSRFFLVVPKGHIHSTMHCSTCYPTTQYAWNPQLSGLTEADAVAALGPILCSVCYPSAPVEWTLGLVADDEDVCPGSGQYVEGERFWKRYQPCPVCDKVAALTPNGLVRKHKAT